MVPVKSHNDFSRPLVKKEVVCVSVCVCVCVCVCVSVCVIEQEPFCKVKTPFPPRCDH